MLVDEEDDHQDGRALALRCVSKRVTGGALGTGRSERVRPGVSQLNTRRCR